MSDERCPIVETQDVHKWYEAGDQRIPVLRGVTMAVERGEFVSIMGPSGSGKSTLLYLLGGLDRPSAGSIRFEGADLATLSDEQMSRLRRRKLGFVFQFFNLVPNLTVEENVLLPILLDGRTERSKRRELERILATVELTDRRRHRPNELSGGQQQRVAIARALISDPELILADEPTGNLDSHTSHEVMELFRRINEEHRQAIVMVTHAPESAAYARRHIEVIDGTVKQPCETTD